jgi:hypothetical protein
MLPPGISVCVRRPVVCGREAEPTKENTVKKIIAGTESVNTLIGLRRRHYKPGDREALCGR